MAVCRIRGLFKLCLLSWKPTGFRCYGYLAQIPLGTPCCIVEFCQHWLGNGLTHHTTSPPTYLILTYHQWRKQHSPRQFVRVYAPESSYYHKISNIRRTKSPNLNVSSHVLPLSLPNPTKPGVKSRMKMELEQRRQVMLQLHLNYRQFYCLLECVLY